MNKICTSIEQSKKLIELEIDLTTADMYWWTHSKRYYRAAMDDGDFNKESDTPAWSLTALLGLMPKIGAHEPMLHKMYYISEPTERYICQYSLTDMTSEYDNPVDACYEMVCWLKENGKL